MRGRARGLAPGLGRVARSAGVALLMACTTEGGGSGWQPGPSLARGGPGKLALLIGIGEYAAGSGWPKLSSSEDLVLMRTTLARQGFPARAVTELKDREATREGILRSAERDLLGPGRPGDLAVLFFAGHGRQVTDEDPGDELDGYDEALVPYDAPYYGAGAERYLRDDTLHQFLERLRRKLGPRGQVVVLLDTCYSGTGTRGDAPVRGAPPLGRPRLGLSAQQDDAGSGFAERGRGGKASEEGLAPLVVFSAARAGESAMEASPPGFRSVGSLTWAVSEAFNRSPLPRSYRTLIEQVRASMAGLVPNVPQAEGALESAVFLGEVVEQLPYFTMTVAAGEERQVRLRPGTLAGLHPGDELEVHRAGATAPAPATLLATGRVAVALPYEATVKLSSPVGRDLLTSARAFVTRQSYGDRRLRLEVDKKLRSADAEGLEARLRKDGAVEMVASAAEVTLQPCAAAPPSVACRALRDRASGEIVWEETAATWEDLVPRLARRLRRLALYRFLRRLDLYDPRVHTELAVAPVELRDCRGPDQPTRQSCRVMSLPPGQIRTAGGEIELPVGSLFELRVEGGREPAFLSVLDLTADGEIALLWPPAGARERTGGGKGARHVLDQVFRVTKPYGTDVFLLVASAEPIDLSLLRWPDWTAVERGDLARLGPFAPLFDANFPRGAGAPELPAVAVSIARQVVRIVPPLPSP